MWPPARSLVNRLVLAFIAGLFFGMAGSAAAAEKMTIRSVETKDYPNIEMRVVIQSSQPPKQITVIEERKKVATVSLDSLTGQSLSVVLLLDLSNSMKGTPLKEAKQAAIQFVDKVGSNQRVSLVTFATKVEQPVGFTTNKSSLYDAIKVLEVQGKTSLYDGVRFGIDRLNSQNSDRKALVVLSDGDDSSSASSLDEVAAYGVKKGVPVYAIAMKSAGLDLPALSKLTADKGRLISDVSPRALSDMFSLMATELRNTYTIKFTSRSNSKQSLVQLYAPAGASVLTASTLIERPVAYIPVSRVDESPFEVGVVSISPLIIILAGILGFSGLAILVASIFLKPRRNSLEETLEYYGDLRPHELADGGAIETNRVVGGLVALVSKVADKRGFTAAIRQMLEAAGLPLNTREYITLHLLAVIGVSLVTLLVTGQSITATLFAVIAALLPIFVLSFFVKRRAAKLNGQLPDTLNSLAGLLRAGYGLMQGIESLIDSSPAPMKIELAKVSGQVSVGVELEQALAQMAARVQSSTFSWLVVAISINRETGGNLAELLDKLSDSMRKRERFRRQVLALAAEGKISTTILIAMPFCVAGALAVLSPAYLSDLLVTTIGHYMLIWGGILMVTGYLWMRKVARVEV